MAVQTTEEFKNGGATSYTITIEYLQISDIKVRIGGALQTYTTGTPGSGEYSVSGTTVTLGAAAPAGTGNVHIYRETDVNTAAAVFAAGSSIRAADLNAVHDMARMGIAEARSQVITADVKEDAITSDKIADDQINSEHYVAGSIDLEHMSANSVDSDQYVDGSIDLIHMSANSVDSDQYVDGSIDLVHMSPNSVDSDQYVDGSIDLVHMSPNSVDSDQYVDGSIDLVHMSPNSVDSDQYVDGSIDTVHIANDQVTYEKIQDVSATDRVLGRDSSGAGVVEEIAPSALRTMINVEDGATADQTNAEIKTAYEANSDTNAFTDAEKTKLGNLGSLNALSDVNTAGVADDKILKYDASVSKFIIADESSGSGGSSTFTGLSDTPVNFGSSAGKVLKVNSGETALEFSDADVVADTTPQLGGNLDVQASEINTSTTNGNIKLGPNGTGVVEVKGNTNAGTLQLNCENNSHGVKIKSPAHSNSADYTVTLFNQDPSYLQHASFVKIDSGGQLSIDNNIYHVEPSHLNMDAFDITFGNTGGIIFDSATPNTAQNDGKVQFFGPTTIPNDVSFVVPNADGNDGDVLKTNGSGALSFGQPEIVKDLSPQLGGNLDVNDKSIDFASDKNISLKTGATNAVVNGVTQHVQQGSLIIEGGNQDIFFTNGGSGRKITFGSSDGATHEVMRITPSVLGASQHGKVDLKYVTANAGSNSYSSTKLSTTSTGINVQGNVVLSNALMPSADSSSDIGTTSIRWRNLYADTLYGDGSNLTGVNPTVANGCIYENSTEITSNHTTSTTKNSMSAGPITIANNVTLTIPNNSVYTIV